ncbi:transmembrane protein [Legionella steigerwaltii]|uniref:Alpha-beta hydrolase family transporter esterase n=1 Tax=Legionella steigerwaltii TaxID=460 RepID=A0A378LA24_9GAMM|nr:patatin-like phospholipase family protein [Legionella steigerwaltii]KTD71946.1 alpha-beta hydrolase family transporter esterase [Legionella steigerwaltii]STY23905.1 transmembrane protein [Legionella steigerwaltii]
MARTKKSNMKQHKHVACCFQGGGALGAYQVGVVHALDEAGYDPDWFVGTSIGAINAAIAAGNPLGERVEKMYQFWETVATPSLIQANLLPNDEASRKMEHFLSAQSALFWGQPGFFTPRIPPLLMGYYDQPDTISFYDTKNLKSTLERFIDFDRINSKTTRLSIGAVEIRRGEMVYFDSQDTKIGSEHIMASGALPPGFPAVEIEGEYYWDGGISSNSPATYVLETNRCPRDLLCFAIHLFDSFGLYPTSLDDVMKRQKDIAYSSRFCQAIHMYQQIHALKNTIHILSNYVPEEERENPELKLCISRGHRSTVSVVRFLCEHDISELSSKDYEFSQKSILERIKQGYLDGRRATKESPWNKKVSQSTGISVYDMSPNKHLKEEI